MKNGAENKKEIGRFLVAGAIVNATDFSIYYLLFHYLPFSIAKGVSFTCASIVGFLLIKFWTFKHKQPSSYAEVGKYALVNSLALGINVLTNQIILSAWHGAVWAALFIATAITGLFTYIGFKWWVFRAKPKKPAALIF